MNPVRLVDLDDPERPWRRVYAAGDRFVKIHARRQPAPFGMLHWRVTGSLCGADGHALTDADGAPLVLGDVHAHEVTVMCDGGADPAATLDEGVALVIGRVVVAATHLEEAP